MDLYTAPAQEIERRGIRMLLPHFLMESVRYLCQDDVLREAFGEVPVDGPYREPSNDAEDFVGYYARIKRAEYHEVTDEVTSHEIDRYWRFP